jgi:putative transposase
VKLLRAFKTQLDLNNKQKTACRQHAGAARFAYNWGLARKKAAMERKEKLPSAMTLHRELNALKKSELAWMYDVSKCAPQEALRDLDRAFAQFFRLLKERRAGKKVKPGFPKFKTKKNDVGSFRLTGAIHVFEKSIQLPRLGQLRLKESGYLPTSGVHILSATISEKAGRWFVSLQVEMEQPDPLPEVKPVVGVDLGINRMAQVSDGSYFENPRALKRNLTMLKRLQRRVSRRQKGSKNRKKAVRQLSNAYSRVGNIRRNALHQATTALARTKSAIVLEDLHVSGMMKNHHLAQAIADVGMYEFKRQLLYKGEWYGCQVLLADRFYPSTKRCSACGAIREIGLKERQYHCPVCGLTMDRDLNAAINLEQLLDLNETTASSAEHLHRTAFDAVQASHACGEHIRWRLGTTVLVEAGTEYRSVMDRFE